MRLLSIITGRLDFELLHSISGRHESDAPRAVGAAAAGHIWYAVKRELIASRRAVRDHGGRARIVEGARELQIADVGDARRQAREHERIAVRERQLRDAALIDH